MSTIRHARGIALTVNAFIRIQLIFIEVGDIEIRWNLQNELIIYMLSVQKILHCPDGSKKNRQQKMQKHILVLCFYAVSIGMFQQANVYTN
jgi:uncharacterized membrane protein